ncbi:MAG TPA: hypothetical protein VKN35_10520, partial [Xanthomonadales bacterium]|nr:hypothetical protein [Xanthomonadales bacterium]
MSAGKIQSLSRVSAICALALVIGACQRSETESNPTEADPESDSSVSAEAPAAETQATAEGNTLVAAWEGPFGGVPAFGTMNLDDLKPALEQGMTEELAEIDEITANPEPPTFENTIVAFEKTGRKLNRVQTYYGIWSSNVSSPEYREIQQVMAPKLAEHRTSISQDQALFSRVRAVFQGSEMADLRPDQQRLVQLVYDRFARNGGTLEGEEKARYAEITQELAELQTQFASNVLADEEGYVTYLEADQLSGLPESFVNAAAAAAAERGEEGKYAVTNTRSSMDPFLTFSDER